MADKRPSRKRLLASVDKVLLKRDVAAADLLRALAILLVPAGLTPRRFGELAKRAFVEFAASAARLRNGKINHSKVAVLTGLSRTEVKRLLATEEIERADRTASSAPIDKVIIGWLSDPRYLSRSGVPRRLPIESASRSFIELVKSYGGDVTYRAALDELQRIGAVRISRRQRNATVRLGHSAAWSRIVGQLSSVAPTVADAIRTAADTALSGRAVAISRLRLYARDPLELSMVRERVNPAVQTLMAGLTESLKRPNTDATKDLAYELTLSVLVSGGRCRRSHELDGGPKKVSVLSREKRHRETSKPET